MEGSCQTFDMLFRGDLRAFFQFYVQWACVSRSTLLPNPFVGLPTRTCFENIVITWLFAVFSIGVTSQDKGGYVMVLQFFSGFSTWNWPFSNIFLKYRCRLLGGTKGNLQILIKGSNFACVEIKSTIFFGKIEIMVLNEKMCLNHIFNIQKYLEGQYT